MPHLTKLRQFEFSQSGTYVSDFSDNKWMQHKFSISQYWISMWQRVIVFPVWKQTAITYWCLPRIRLSSHHSMTIYSRSLERCTVTLKQYNCIAWHNSAQKFTSCTVLLTLGEGWMDWKCAAGDDREERHGTRAIHTAKFGHSVQLMILYCAMGFIITPPVLLYSLLFLYDPEKNIFVTIFLLLQKWRIQKRVPLKHLHVYSP